MNYTLPQIISKIQYFIEKIDGAETIETKRVQDFLNEITFATYKNVSGDNINTEVDKKLNSLEKNKAHDIEKIKNLTEAFINIANCHKEVLQFNPKEFQTVSLNFVKLIDMKVSLLVTDCMGVEPLANNPLAT
jgi:hypothetical protein